MTDLKVKKNVITCPEPKIIIDEEGEVLFFNEAAENKLNLTCPDTSSDEKVSPVSRFSKQLFHSRLGNLISETDCNDSYCHILPLKSSQNGGKQLYLITFNNTQTVERYLHYLKSIHKISGKSYKYKKIYSLSRFVVNELYDEEYKYFHVGLFLIDFLSKENRVKLIAVAGESKDLFEKYSTEKYLQSTKIGVIGRVFETGETLVIPDTRKIDYYHATP